MDEPRRLKDQPGSDLERALLKAGTSYRSPTGARLRTLLALGLAGTLSGIASHASASALAKSSWIKVLALSALGAAVAVPVVKSGLSDAPSAQTASITAAVPARAPSAPMPVEPAEEPEAAPETPDAAPMSSTPEPSNPHAQHGERAKLRPLGSELATLDAVRLAITRGEAKRALGLLDGYARSYPRGRMRVEAEVLRIDAYAKSGQTERARTRAQAFLKRRPNSVFAARVQSYL